MCLWTQRCDLRCASLLGAATRRSLGQRFVDRPRASALGRCFLSSFHQSRAGPFSGSQLCNNGVTALTSTTAHTESGQWREEECGVPDTSQGRPRDYRRRRPGREYRFSITSEFNPLELFWSPRNCSRRTILRRLIVNIHLAFRRCWTWF